MLHRCREYVLTILRSFVDSNSTTCPFCRGGPDVHAPMMMSCPREMNVLSVGTCLLPLLLDLLQVFRRVLSASPSLAQRAATLIVSHGSPGVVWPTGHVMVHYSCCCMSIDIGKRRIGMIDHPRYRYRRTIEMDVWRIMCRAQKCMTSRKILKRMVQGSHPGASG